MSNFLEEVLSAPPHHHRRKQTTGLSNSARYAAMITVLAGLTAVPTWIVLKTGADSITSNAPLPVSPLLNLPSSSPIRVPDEPVPPKKVPPRVVPPEPALPPVKMPVEEHKAAVDTPDRPVRKKKTKPPSTTPSTPAAPPVSAVPAPSSPTGTPSPAWTLPSAPSTWQPSVAPSKVERPAALLPSNAAQFREAIRQQVLDELKKAQSSPGRSWLKSAAPVR